MLTCSPPLPVKLNNSVVALSCGFPWYIHCGSCQCTSARCHESTSHNVWFCANQSGMLPRYIYPQCQSRKNNKHSSCYISWWGGSIVAWGCCWGHYWWVWTIRRLDYSTWDKNCTCPLSCNSEWIGTPSTMTGTTLSLSPMSAPTLALAEFSSVERGWNCQSMGGGSLSWGLHSGQYIHCRSACPVVHHNQICHMRGWGNIVQQHILHVRPHCNLVGRQLVDGGWWPLPQQRIPATKEKGLYGPTRQRTYHPKCCPCWHWQPFVWSSWLQRCIVVSTQCTVFHHIVHVVVMLVSHIPMLSSGV